MTMARILKKPYLNKYPHLEFVKVLLVGRLSAAAINDTLVKLGLGKVDFDDLAALRRDIVTVYPDQEYLYPIKKYQTEVKRPCVPADADIDWLVETNLSPMFGHYFKIEVPSTTGIQGAFNLLDDPLMFRLVTALAITGITDEDIELLVNGKYNQHYGSEDITEFLNYFFNLKKWTRVQKAHWIKAAAPPEFSKYYKIALKGDKDYLIWKLGAAPDKSFEQMLAEMSTDAYYNFKEQSRTNPETAQKWGGLAVKLIEKLDKVKKDEQKSNDFFDMIEFSVDSASGDTDVLHIEDLEEMTQIAEKHNPNNDKDLI
jgi:hypothetical protein